MWGPGVEKVNGFGQYLALMTDEGEASDVDE